MHISVSFPTPPIEEASYMHFGLFFLQIWGDMLHKPPIQREFCKAPIQRGLHKAPRGFVHTYIHISVFSPADMGVAP